MNYKDESCHDQLVIALIKNLNTLNRIDLFTSIFGLPHPDNLERATRRKLFDIELTFNNLSCIIETKVDSDEGNRWGKDKVWQTERIAQASNGLGYLKPSKFFFFITYGTSEYYGKTPSYKNGPASSIFKHIKLDDMITLLQASLVLPLENRPKYEQWLEAMLREQNKRMQALEMLKTFSSFRRHYLQVHQDIDFPHNRLTFCAPELAFPLLFGLAEYWNSTPALHEQFGRVLLYPVSRMSPPVHDSILNFWEMWSAGKPLIGKNLLADQGSLYFEINEDFNLNLKLESETLS